MRLPLYLVLMLATLSNCLSQDSSSQKEEKETPAAEKPAPQPLDEEEFFSAALEGKPEIVKKALLNPKAATHADADGRTALMLASFNGQTAIADMLIQAGANVDAKDSTKRTALMYASTGPDTKILELLIKHKANVNLADGHEHWTPIMFAAAEGQTNNVLLLLKSGADPSAADVDGEDAAHFATSKGFHELAKLINQAKAEKKGN